MTFEYTQLGLADILKQNRLVVPRNQRDYAWTAKEVKTLLEDLGRSINEGHDDYFLGTIVTIKGDNEVLEVVDGQQRLATTAIVLAEIRDYLKSRNRVRADFIESEFLTSIDWDSEERGPSPSPQCRRQRVLSGSCFGGRFGATCNQEVAETPGVCL